MSILVDSGCWKMSRCSTYLYRTHFILITNLWSLSWIRLPQQPSLLKLYCKIDKVKYYWLIDLIQQNNIYYYSYDTLENVKCCNINTIITKSCIQEKSASKKNVVLTVLHMALIQALKKYIYELVFSFYIFSEANSDQ